MEKLYERKSELATADADIYQRPSIEIVEIETQGGIMAGSGEMGDYEGLPW